MGYMGGYTVRASSAAIAYLWSNWEVVYLVCPGLVKARRLTETSWEGSGFGGYGEWHLTKSQFAAESGHFEFYTMSSFFGCKFSMQVSNDYNRIDDQRVSYFGSASVPIKNVNMLLRPIIRVLMNQGGTYCNRIGASAAEQISINPSLVADKAGSEAFKTYQQYMDEEAAIRRGGTGTFRFMTPGTKSIVPQVGELELLRKRLENLEASFSALGGTLDLKEFRSSLLVFASDPKMALVKNRTIVEQIARIVFEQEFSQPSGTRMLGQLLDQIAKDSENIPASIMALMRTVSYLGNVGSHVASKNSAQSSVDACEFGVSFSATLRITEWFFSEYLPSVGGLNGK